MGNVGKATLLTVVVRGAEMFLENEWGLEDGHGGKIPIIKGKAGKEMTIRCRTTTGSTHQRANKITGRKATSCIGESQITTQCISSTLDCWHDFILVQSVYVICLGVRDQLVALTFKFKINIIEPSMTRSPSLSLPTTSGPVPTGPSGLTPFTFSIGTYVIKNMGRQQILLDSFYSLKRVELSIQISIVELQPLCSPFWNTAHTGWLAWLRGRTPTSHRTQRDLTDTLGTGMGISNSIDAEVLANKLAAATKDVQGLQPPFRSSLSALGANQWLLSDILPQWKQINENDRERILEALGTAQSNISLALSYIQAQLWVQSVASAIIREGEEGVLPSEVHKVIWDNANEFEKEFQSWWQVVNFTYNPTNQSATAFALAI